MSDMFYTKFVQENARNEAWKKTNSTVNTNIATTTEESFVKALSDTRLSKEELLSLSMQFEKEKTSLEESVQIRYKSLMKESLDEMLKEYTIANASDLQYLKNLIILTGAPYTTNDINLDKSPVKVRLDQKDNRIKPLHGLQGVFTKKDTSRINAVTFFNFRKDEYIQLAIKNGFSPIPPEKKIPVQNYLEDKFAIINGDISGGHENNGFASSERAYRDIINFVTTGGAEKRAPSGAETIHIRNKKEAQLVKSYLLDLINNDIPNARNKAPVETTTSPQVSPVTESNQTAATQTKANPIESKNSNDTLEFKAKYAEEQLKLAGVTVTSLKQKLKDNKFYTGDINGKFDQATLDAVVGFQKSVPNIQYGPDGLVGPVTIGILFGKKVVPNTGTIVTPAKTPSGKPNNTSNVPIPVLSNGSVVSPLELNKETPTIAGLTKAMDEFRQTYKAVNEKTNTVWADHEKDIETRNVSIQGAARPVIQILQSLDPSKLTEQEYKTYESMKLEVAKYFSNELSGIRSRQYTDYSFAFSLAESIIAPILKESNIALPPAPTQDDIEQRMKRINPSLHTRYTEALRKGWTPGQFLSNPKIRAEWADVQSKINGEYEDAVQRKLAELMGNNAVLKTPEQYEALALMTTIMGSSNFLDFKKRNIDAWIQTGGAIGSGIGGAIAGVAIIGTTGWTGVGAVAGASVIGASIATAGAAISRGRYDERYLMTEGGINLVTFGVAGTIGKLAKARYIDQGNKIAGYSLDSATGLALGVSGEYTRALSDGANFKDLPHGKMILMQLPWALLPMTMGGLANLKGRAQKLDKAVQTIRSQANIGDQNGAARTAQAIAPEVESLANTVKAEIKKDNTPMVGDTTNNVLGQSISPNPGVATPKTKPVASLAAHDTIASPAPQMNEQQFTAWFTDLVPKVDKKKFPVGSTIKSEGVEITALEGGKYSMKHGAVIYNYDSHAEFTANIGKIIKTPSERLALLKSTESNRILNHMKGYTGIEVPGAPGLRWKHDGHGKMSFEKKNQENGSWNAVEIAALTPEEQLAAAAHFYGVKPSQILEGIKKSEGTSAHEAIGHAEKEGFIKKNGLTAWHKVEEGFKKIKDGTIGAGKTAVGAPFNILSWVTNWGHGASWGKSFATGAVLEGISMATHPFDTEQWRDSDGNINWGNAGEALAYALIAANCGIPRALLASGAWGMYDLYSHSNIAQKPGAEVLAK